MFHKYMLHVDIIYICHLAYSGVVINPQVPEATPVTIAAHVSSAAPVPPAKAPDSVVSEARSAAEARALAAEARAREASAEAAKSVEQGT